MSLRPVNRDYEPDYPKHLSDVEIEILLRPSLFRRFAAKTLAAGAVLTTVGLSGLLPGAPVPKPTPLPKAGLSTNKDAKFQEKIHRMAKEILGAKVGTWNPRTMVKPQTKVQGNPPVKYPHIPISYGNSYVGVFDTEKAKQATKLLFAEWGIQLQADVSIKGKDYEFIPDGYNKELGIGFKIIMPQGHVGLSPKKYEPVPDARKLDAKELKELEKQIQAGKERIFVVDATGFPNMDGDLYTPLEYYLASVIDYLNYVHGDKNFDQLSVLAKQRQLSGTPPRGVRKVIEKQAQPDVKQEEK